MTFPNSRPTASRATVEVCNALRAETFRKLPDDIPLWRFREVLLRLRKHLGLSDGAVTYALDVMGLLTEADWRGDGRPVTYTSIRNYARKVEKCERTIGNYEAQLVAAGLAHRTLKHARRHGGQGSAERRTGLDWRAFGVALPDLIARIEARDAQNRRCLDLEARIRAEKRLIRGLADGLEEGRAQTVEAEIAATCASPLQACLCIAELEPILTALTLLRDRLTREIGPIPTPPPVAPVEKAVFSAQASVQSESICVHKEITTESSSPAEIRICLAEKGCSEAPHPKPTGRAGRMDPVRPKKTSTDKIPLDNIWYAAPLSWADALGPDVPISWPAVIEVATHIAPHLDVSPQVWGMALRALGPSDAALALMVLDRNRDHPTRPVRSVGAALTGMIRRAGQGSLNLAPSVHGIIARSKAHRPTPPEPERNRHR